MSQLPKLLAANKGWAERIKAEDPEFFEQLAEGQAPEYLWVGCADSRVPANQVLDQKPGSVFVHRNVANLVVATDVNFQSVLQYAVQALKVRHIIICGHTSCGGVEAGYDNNPLGLIDQWLRPINQLALEHKADLDKITDRKARLEKLVELNVRNQVLGLARMPVVQQAWRDGQALSLHGLKFTLATGLLSDLDTTFDGSQPLPTSLSF